MPQYTILVADDGPGILEMITSFLSRLGYQTIGAHNGEEALRLIAREKPDLAILDVMMPELDGFEVCRRLRANPATAKLPVLILTARGGVADKITGLQAGADDYMVKPFDMRELALRIQALLTRTVRTDTQQRGRVITCFSLKGGVGVSSLAANLAVSLSQMWQSKVVLVDLAINSGHASLLLDLDPTYTVADLANESAEDLPGELLDRYLISHSSGVRLLGAPSSNAMTEDLSPRLVDGFLPTLVESFEYVVIDTMHHFSQATVAAVEHTDLLVLVVTPTVAAVKAASDALAILSAIGFPGDQIVPVLNRTFPREGFTRDRVEQTLHRKVATEIPYEGQSMVRAMNRGIPLVTLAPRSRAASAIELLAYNLSEDGQQERRKEASNPVLQRIKRRLLRTSRDAK